MAWENWLIYISSLPRLNLVNIVRDALVTVSSLYRFSYSYMDIILVLIVVNQENLTLPILSFKGSYVSYIPLCKLFSFTLKIITSCIFRWLVLCVVLHQETSQGRVHAQAADFKCAADKPSLLFLKVYNVSSLICYDQSWRSQ